MRSVSRCKALPAAVLVAVLVLSGCDGGDGGDGGGGGGAEASSSASATPSEAGSPSEEPTTAEPTEPAVVPASGPELTMDVATVRLPEGWELTDGQASFLATGTDPGAGATSFIGLSQFPSLTPDPTPAELEETVLDGDLRGRGEVQDPVEVDGVEMRRLTGRDGSSSLEVFIALVDGDLVTLKIRQGKDIPQDARDEVVASVLASFSWT
ncbi:hypothetical protein [Nocardioides sp. 1609]|uniref:hypothetical protein n=1 Tax=Nocardioides sp. 1609 TaxID=2508327 RepID=UPI001431982C|nr:hypothetical protein [Nocardioides sp. 1609]